MRTPAEWALEAGGIAATVIVTIYVTRLARAKLRGMTSGSTQKYAQLARRHEKVKYTREESPHYYFRMNSYSVYIVQFIRS